MEARRARGPSKNLFRPMERLVRPRRCAAGGRAPGETGVLQPGRSKRMSPFSWRPAHQTVRPARQTPVTIA